MGSGFAKMKKQAKLMEQQIEQMKESMKNSSYTGTSGNGLVTITLNGEKELKEIKIKPECVDPNDVEGLEDLIRAAFDDAKQKISNESDSNFSLPSGMSLPSGFSFPF
ncbi:MAG: YbaB/EbfC family nucleoid-associated protein [Chlamydiae bacterium]|nr:YbaB/EbfC family nucleoid-associated protein [Chlamydiota bacterium]